jgi:glycosyltransferase involved in cell wall biosynthesis
MNTRRLHTTISPRVLHIITGLGTGGAESSLVRIIARSRTSVTHAVISLTSLGSRGAELSALGVEVHALGLARGTLAPHALWRLRRLAQAFAPTCTQGWMYHGNLAASALAFTGARTGPVLWNVRHALDAWTGESRTLRALIRASAILSRHPHRIIYNSHRSASQHAERGYARSAAHVIPNGVDLDRFAPDRPARDRVRAALGIPGHAFVVGMIARVDPLKDHDTLFEAIRQHARTDRETWYVLAGTDTAPGRLGVRGVLDARMHQLTAAHPELLSRVLRLGERHDIPDVINACDVVTMTSRSEGSPNAVTEAMACGVPCVVTDVGDAARLVSGSGIVVPVGNATAIADAWRVLRAEGVRFAARKENALERIRTHFAADAERDAYRTLWREASGLRAAAPAPRLLLVTTISTTLRAFLLPIADHFRARGWRVDALAAGAESDPALLGHFDATHNIAWSRNPLSLQNFAAVRRIRAIVRDGAYDVVHVHTPIAAFVARFALRHSGVRVVYTAHGFHANPAGSRLGNALFRWLERRAARWTDYLVVMNEHDAVLARQDALVAEDHLMHHPGVGIDVTQYRPLTRTQRARVRADLGASLTQVIVVVVAEFNRNKRQRDVVSALARMRDEGLIVMPTVWFIGDGPRRAAVARQARAAGVDHHVRFLGQREDCASLIGAADALVLASRREGLPRCLLEAMAMEVPAIASAARGSTDLLSGDRGWLFPIGNASRLAEVLNRVLTDVNAARLRADAAARYVHANASLEHVLARHEVLYDAARRGVPLPDSTVTTPARLLAKREFHVPSAA